MHIDGNAMRSAVALLASGLALVSCRPAAQPGGVSGSGASGACYQSDQSNQYTKATLCLGPPDMPPGAFVLFTDRMVPDAHLRDRCEGSFHTEPGGIVLNVQRCQNQTTDMQRGQQSSSQYAESYQLRATQQSPDGLLLTLRGGQQVPLHR